MGNRNLWKRKVSTVSDEYLKEPRVCSWKLRGSWVDVFHDRLEEQDCSDDHTVVLIRLIRDKHKPVMQKVGFSDRPLASTDELVLNSPANTADDIQQELETDFEEELKLGEITENKQTAIMTTLHKHSRLLCEGVSITCLAAILYSNHVMDSMVFVGIANTTQKSQYLVQEIFRAVESDPTKFEALCCSLSMAHSATYAQLIWDDYKTELEKLECDQTVHNQMCGWLYHGV